MPLECVLRHSRKDFFHVMNQKRRGGRLVKFKSLIILLVMSVFICNSVCGQIRSSGFSKEFIHSGFHFGTYNSGLGWKGYTAGLMMSYYNQADYGLPDFLNNLGFFTSLAYFSDPDDDLSFTAQLSKGIWLTETSLIQCTFGPLMSFHNGFGVSGTVLVGIDNLFPFTEIKSGVVFLQSDRYRISKVGDVKWRYTLGISLGI